MLARNAKGRDLVHDIIMMKCFCNYEVSASVRYDVHKILFVCKNITMISPSDCIRVEISDGRSYYFFVEGFKKCPFDALNFYYTDCLDFTVYGGTSFFLVYPEPFYEVYLKILRITRK